MGVLTAHDFFGGSKYLSTGSTTSVNMSNRFWAVVATAGGLTINLPNPTKLYQFGSEVIIVVNVGGTNSFTIASTAVSHSLAPGKTAMFGLYFNGSANRWSLSQWD